MKLKNVKSALSAWSKATFGYIFKQLTVREEVVRIKEQCFEEDPTPMNRMVLQQAQAALKKYIRRIQNQQGVWIEGESLLAEEACRFYQQQFSQEVDPLDFELLQHVPSMVDQDTNNQLVCLDIVGANVYNPVKAFFDGQTLPKSVTHTNLVLLPKKNNIETFADMRPISLSNFINKVISRVVQDKLDGILPSLISPNQSGFFKGRCIIENVLLTQEVVTDIRLREKPANVVLKLDMAKAYDIVSWSYLIRVLRKMGFVEIFIDMVWRLIANNWTTNTLWANYMWIKYCKRHSPQTVQWKGGSQVWKAMIEARDNIEQEIWWEPRSGTANVWFDNWTKLGALYHIIPDDFEIDEGVQDVKELMLQDGWNIGKLQ
ncbi:uncharacterized protein LOC132630998 [Lycium barbarum]|uniref:uncharacterized protein LOC132630998 n=1 Tax=Lycium barbarum TaxID=112863 RepID=UPI00293F37AA|nr:uncharacterized protein LOC132630998 [Lycium barbarum]